MTSGWWEKQQHAVKPSWHLEPEREETPDRGADLGEVFGQRGVRLEFHDGFGVAAPATGGGRDGCVGGRGPGMHEPERRGPRFTQVEVTVVEGQVASDHVKRAAKAQIGAALAGQGLHEGDAGILHEPAPARSALSRADR